MKPSPRKHPFLYSAGTFLAYKIEKDYYDDVHYVWCTTSFNDIEQPPTSNPSTICKRYLEQMKTGDRHTKEITNNMAGILRGAKAKLECGVINKAQYEEIRGIVSRAEYEVFYPVLYIIKTQKVKEKCIEVPVSDKASVGAVEYKIEELLPGEFEVVNFKSFLDGVIPIAEGRVS